MDKTIDGIFKILCERTSENISMIRLLIRKGIFTQEEFKDELDKNSDVLKTELCKNLDTLKDLMSPEEYKAMSDFMEETSD